MSPPRFRRASSPPRSRSPSTPRQPSPNKSRNTPLQKQSNGNGYVRVQPPPCQRHTLGHPQCRERMLVDRSAVADRRKAKTDRDRKSDDAARLQAGADADAETGDGVLQRQFAVAERLRGPFQRSRGGGGPRAAGSDPPHT